jgi:hypothetical protein
VSSEYSETVTFVIERSTQPELIQTSTYFHDAAAYPSIPTYSSDRRPSYPPSWAQDVRNSSTHVAAAQSSEYRATIARLSDDFLASASSLFGGSTSRTRNTSATLSGHTTPHQSPMQKSNLTPARKRSSEAMNEEVFVDQVPALVTCHPQLKI